MMKDRMMAKRMMFATMVLTVFMVSSSIWLKAQMIEATKVQSPPSVSKSTGRRRLIF